MQNQTPLEGTQRNFEKEKKMADFSKKIGSHRTTQPQNCVSKMQ